MGGMIVLALALSFFSFRPALADEYEQYMAPTPPLSPSDERKTFHLPPGFEIELVASEPAVPKPINIAFDEKGRLWVTSSTEYPFPARGRAGKDRILVLESTKGDGFADKVTTFADGLNIPVGIAVTKKGAIVYSIPNIYKLTDTNDDGRADKREVLYSTFGFEDTHGMASNFVWGNDGWIYACHGFSNTSKVTGRNGGKPLVMHSGNTFRMRPDGSEIQPFTRGQVNPFGLAFDPLGNLYSADCHSQPIYMLLKGAYYPSFGKMHDGMGFGPEMMAHDHGSTAIAGVLYYAADQFPPEYRDTLFVGNVVTNRINHDKIEKHGSTYRAILQPDFLVSDDPWFRPVAIQMGPDGAMYVADFYNRIIGHYEVPLTHPGRDHERGRIWRIYYKGNPLVSPTKDLRKASLGELAADLGHANLLVRMKAANELSDRGGLAVIEAMRALTRPEYQASAFQKAHAMWVLHRLGALDSATLLAGAADRDAVVRVHTMKILAERPGMPAHLRDIAIGGLTDADAFVKRAAAQALGAHPSRENIRPLLEARARVPADDTHLLHVIRMALRDQLVPAGAFNALTAEMNDEETRSLADAAGGVPSAEAAEFLLSHLERVSESGENVVRYVHHVARYAPRSLRARLLRFAQAYAPRVLRLQAALFKAYQQGSEEGGSSLEARAKTWGETLTFRLLDATETASVLDGVELAGILKITGVEKKLEKKALDRKIPASQRQAAMGALAEINAQAYTPFLGKCLREAVDEISIREEAARLLGGINSNESRAELAKSLASAPARLQSVIAISLVSSEEGAGDLLGLIASGKASARLLQEAPVKLRVEKFGALKARIAKLTEGLPTVDTKLDEVIKARREGYKNSSSDPKAGALVFEKNCRICHTLMGRGAKVGPQLDGIGSRGLERLLEDVLDPNRNVDQAFRSSTISLKSGKLVTGLVLREEGNILIVADGQGKELRLRKDDIEERFDSQLSPMPSDFAARLTESELYDLMAFLLERR